MTHKKTYVEEGLEVVAIIMTVAFQDLDGHEFHCSGEGLAVSFKVLLMCLQSRLKLPLVYKASKTKFRSTSFVISILNAVFNQVTKIIVSWDLVLTDLRVRTAIPGGPAL